MRKMVIDGSTPFGFQRSAIVALNGGVEIGGKSIPIQTVCVEEDACRKTGEKDTTVYYRTDRLGAPLIEVVTGPVIRSPEEAEEVALALGRILRVTGKVKRGIGTIRQDLNISIRDGAISEVKGVQELELISKVVQYEIQRQITLLEIQEKLRERGVKVEDVKGNLLDVTEVFKGTECRVIKSAVENGCRVIAVVLPELEGLLSIELNPGIRFGTELSDYAKFWGGVDGLFHTDELPAFGITDGEVTRLRRFLKVIQRDAIVFVADRKENAVDALNAVVERVKAAIAGIPNETRSAHSDGTTHYSRPRPGAARMYPETDVPPVPITVEFLEKIRVNLPEPPDVKLFRLMNEYGLNRKLAAQLLNSDYCDIFEAVALRKGLAASFIAATLMETFKDLARKGVDVTLLSDSIIEGVFVLVDSGVMAKEAIPEVLTWMVQHQGAKLKDAVEALGLRMVTEEELVALVEKAVQENVRLIKERGVKALGPLMGTLMKEMRGKIDAKRVSSLLKKRIDMILRG